MLPGLDCRKRLDRSRLLLLECRRLSSDVIEVHTILRGMDIMSAHSIFSKDFQIKRQRLNLRGGGI